MGGAMDGFETDASSSVRAPFAVGRSCLLGLEIHARVARHLLGDHARAAITAGAVRALALFVWAGRHDRRMPTNYTSREVSCEHGQKMPPATKVPGRRMHSQVTVATAKPVPPSSSSGLPPSAAEKRDV